MIRNFLIFFSFCFSIESADGVVAVVGDFPILKSSVLQSAQMLLVQQGKQSFSNQEELNSTLTLLNSAKWSETFYAIESVRRLAIFNKELLMPHLELVINVTLRNCMNLRSAIAFLRASMSFFNCSICVVNVSWRLCSFVTSDSANHELRLVSDILSRVSRTLPQTCDPAGISSSGMRRLRLGVFR